MGDFNYFNSLAVYACNLGLDRPERQALIKSIEADHTKSKTPPTKGDSWTGDVNSTCQLHDQPEFDKFFKLASVAVDNYMTGLGVNTTMLDTYFTRSWAVRQEGSQAVSLHDHAQSHISICYYPEAHPAHGAFVIAPQELPNEFFPNLFSNEHHKTTGLVDANNPHTQACYNLKPQDDMLLIFPSKMHHQVRPNSDTYPTLARYSVSSDIICTLKSAHLYEHGLPPLPLWKKLEILNE